MAFIRAETNPCCRNDKKFYFLIVIFFILIHFEISYPIKGSDPLLTITYNDQQVYSVINTQAQVFTGQSLFLGDALHGNHGDPNTKVKNIVIEEAYTSGNYANNAFHNALLRADGTYVDVDVNDSQRSTAVCCGETFQQGCGDNAISYDFHDDPAKTTWAATLTSEEQRCNALDASTGKPHVWKTLFAR